MKKSYRAKWKKQTSRLQRMLAGLAAVFLAVTLTSCGPQAEQSKGVELVVAEPLKPESTFEVRFDQPMAGPGQIGVATTNSPLVIDPVLAGSFTWTSSRSGVFTPQAPLEMEREYEVSLRHGLVGVDGKVSAAVLRRTLRTPGFVVTGFWPDQASTNATSEPEIKVCFNADVSTNEASHFFEFQAASGKRIAAVVRQGTEEDSGGEFSSKCWNNSTSSQSYESTNPVENLLIVSPKDALDVGQNWKLVLTDGLPAADQRLHLHNGVEIPIGDVTAFTLENGEAHHVVSQKPVIELNFSKVMASTMTNEWRKWIVVKPEAENLTAEIYGRRMFLRGDFASDVNYKVTAKKGLPADERFKLSEDMDVELFMPEVPRRLYFPAFSQDQEAGGNRTFPLLSVNVKGVQVRAKLVSTETVVHALRGFKGYEPNRGDHWQRDEPYRRVDYDLMAGRTVFDQTFSLHGELDETTTTTLSWNRLLAGRRTGVVFLEATRERERDEVALGTEALIQLTDIGMVWKRNGGFGNDDDDTSAYEVTSPPPFMQAQPSVEVFAFSQATGEPLAGATVQLLGDENEIVSEGKADVNGVAHLAVKDKAAWVAVRHEEDFHVLEMKEHQLPLYSFNVPTSWRGKSTDLRKLMLFSDRDVYRPGETVYLKALGREWGEQGLNVAAGLHGVLKCWDPRGREYLNTNIVMSEHGSWSMAMKLPLTDRGGYRFEMSAGRQEFTHYFRVEDFQPSAFEITMKAQEVYGPGEKIEVPLSARYYFGQELTKAKVKWSLRVDDFYFQAKGFEEFSFNRSYAESAGVTLNGEGELTGKSNFIIAPEIPTNHARTVSLLAEVTDINQQTLTRRAEFVRHSSDFYLGLRQTNSVVMAGSNVLMEVVAVGTNCLAWSGMVKGHLKLERRDWHPVLIRGAGRTARYRNESTLTNVLERELELNGITSAVFDPLEAGEYLVLVTAADSAGRAVASSTEFNVSASGRTGWNYRNEVQITLKPDKASYAPGETAQILVETPISGTAWVTVEREKVLRSFVVKLEGNAPMISVPMAAGDAPNVFVSVMLVRGAEKSSHKIQEPEYRMGYCQVNVENPGSKLEVKVTPSETSFLPGQEAEAGVLVNNEKGEPVAGAEVTLYAVDEGILDLSGYAVPDPFAVFYATRELAVSSAISLPNLLTEDPEQMHFGNKGYLGGGGGWEKPRKNFLACAFWQATLMTDANGKAVARFIAPDSMTRYKVIAVVAAGGGSFGHGESAFAVSKPLLVEPALPRFGCITDKISGRAVVHNQTEKDGEVVVSLLLDDTAKGSGLERRVMVPANGSVAVDFPVELVETGLAKWVWKVRFADAAMGNFTDAVESTLEIAEVTPLLREVISARIGAEETNLLQHANPQILEGKGKMKVTVSNSRLNELGEAVRQLLHYPYGCAEQTGSSLLPWLVLRDLPVMKPHLTQSKLDATTAIRAGVTRLFSMQTQSGGLSYWPGEREPMFWASAYGGLVLAIAKEHGVALPEEDFQKLLHYLGEELHQENERNLSDECLALYALAVAGKAEPAYHEKLYALRGKLSEEDRALLALAITQANGPKSMVEELLMRPGQQVEAYEAHFGGVERMRAIQLLAWVQSRADDPEVDVRVTQLMAERKEGGWWTTQGNAWSLLALTEYGRKVEGELAAPQGELRYDGVVYPFDTNHFSRELKISAGKPLAVVNKSKRKLYVTVSLEARSLVLRQPRQDNGFSVRRTYQRLDDDNHAQETNVFRVGDRVLVTLKLGLKHPASYVAVDDPLPSIFEAVNPAFKSQEARGVADEEYSWRGDFHELRKDRALFFSDDLSAGNYVIQYLARVRAVGTVTAPAVRVEEMYRPQRFGMAETKFLEGRE